MGHQVKINSVRPCEGGAVLAYITVVIDGTTYRDCTVIGKDGQKGYVREPVACRPGEDGRLHYWQVVSWSPTVREAVNRVVLSEITLSRRTDQAQSSLF